MKRKILSLLFILMAFTIMITGCEKKETPEEKIERVPDDGKALIWEVKSDTATVYLVGSIHLAKESTYPLKKVLMDAFEDSSILAVEADITAESEISDDEMVLSFMYTDGSTVKDYLTPDTFEKLEKYMKTFQIIGLPTEYLYYFKPVFISQLIEEQIYTSIGFFKTPGIDEYFLNLANEKEMKIVEVESVKFQMDMMTGFSDEIQEYILLSTLTSTKMSYKLGIEFMLKMWQQGDAENFSMMLKMSDYFGEVYMDEDEKRISAEYNKIMMDDRNDGMTDKVEEFLKGNETVFYVVGSAHMFGDTGIVNQLEERGHTVTVKRGK
jgi:Uncharacterized protein conserved in bacteria